MLRKVSVFIGLAWLLALSATPALAGGPLPPEITQATATANCQGYSLTVWATNLPVGTTYTIDYSFTVTCGGAAPVTVPGSVTFQATATSQSVTASGTFSPTITLKGSCDVSGSATLTSSGSTVAINVNKAGAGNSASLTCPVSPLTLACQPATTGTVGTPYNSCLMASGGVSPYSFFLISPATLPPGLTLTTTGSMAGCITGTPTQAGTFNLQFEVEDSETPPVEVTATCPLTIASQLPTQCVIPPSGTAIPGAPVSWNGFKGGSVVWINAHISGPGNVLTNMTTTVVFTQVTLVVNGQSYALPNGTINFVPGTTAPTTAVNADGSWTTTVSPTQSGDIFFDGQAIPVDANLQNGGGGNTSSTLSFYTNSNDSALRFQWQWGAAVYTYWPGNASAMIEPVQANGLQAGAPTNSQVQSSLIQGPRGGGGSNFTGSWSGTGHGTCPGTQ
jgi:hypothetical protein